MTIVADAYTYVIGVDTHAATHHYAIIETRSGALIAHAQFPTHPKGLHRASDWIDRRTLASTGGDLGQVLLSIEGTGSYGGPLAQLLSKHGFRVTDAPSPKRERGSGKNDHIDALAAARGILHKHPQRLAQTKTGAGTAALRTLLTARRSITSERTRSVNALNAHLRGIDLGLDARTKASPDTITTIAAWRHRSKDDLAQATARHEAIRLATRIQELILEDKQNQQALAQIVKDTAPGLLDLFGVGPINAATVLTAWDAPDRFHSEAAFARLGGVCPLEASSGNRQEHRLNRSGDRQLNRALHNIAINRRRHDERTKAYVKRRTAEGLSPRRIQRCLKRYIARELYRHLANAS